MGRLFREAESERDEEQVSLMAIASDAGYTSTPELISSSEPSEDEASRRATRQRKEAMQRVADDEPSKHPPALTSDTEQSEEESADNVKEPPTKRMKSKSTRKMARKRAAKDRRLKVAKLMDNFAPPHTAPVTSMPTLINVGEILPAIAAAPTRIVGNTNRLVISHSSNSFVLCGGVGACEPTLTGQSASGALLTAPVTEAYHRLPSPEDDSLFMADVEETERSLAHVEWIGTPSSLTMIQGAAFALGAVTGMVIIEDDPSSPRSPSPPSSIATDDRGGPSTPGTPEEEPPERDFSEGESEPCVAMMLSDKMLNQIDHRAFHMRSGSKFLLMILDSGCTCHIFSGPKECMTNYKSTKVRIATANASSVGLWAIGIGDFPIIMTDDYEEEVRATLLNVLHAPSSSVSLFSVPSFLKVLEDRGSVTFKHLHAQLMIDETIIEAQRDQNLYTLEVELQHPSAEEFSAAAVKEAFPGISNPFEGVISKTEKMAIALHLARCHEPWRLTRSHLVKGNALGIEDPALVKDLIAVKALACLVCEQGKMHVTSLPKKVAEDWSKYSPFQYFQVDTCGPFEVQAGGLRHFTLWIDAGTRGGFLFFTKTINSNILVRQTIAVDAIARRHTEGIRYVGCDQHPAWMSKEVSLVFQQRGITRRGAEVDGHGQIGLAERTFRTLQERALCLMLHSGVPRSLFFYAVRHVFYTLQHDTASGTSKHELLFGIPTSFCQFFPFGCLGIAISGQRGKLELSSYGKQFVLVGYAEQFKRCYYLYDPQTQRIIVRGDRASLRFHPEQLPGLYFKFFFESERRRTRAFPR